MQLKDFKLIKNRQRPDFCYSYEKKNNTRKYTIFTMNGGQTFHASIEEPRLDGKWSSELSQNCNTIDECLRLFVNFK